jgi:hypothetical protein
MSFTAKAKKIAEWNKGIFVSELREAGIVPRPISHTTDSGAKRLITPPSSTVPKPLASGSFAGSQKAATEMFTSIWDRFQSFFDVSGLETKLPLNTPFEDKKAIYQYQKPGSDKYPPHLNIIPEKDQTSLLKIFDAMRLLDTGTLLGRVIPENILDFIHDDPNADGSSIAAIEARNKELRLQKKDIFTEPNIGDRSDWYSDAVFAQQQFTGTNPTTLTVAPPSRVEDFKRAAKAQKNDGMLQILSSAPSESLYVQDYSFFKPALEVSPASTLQSDNNNDDNTRYMCGAVTLFNLTNDGKLHPLAIVPDHKDTFENSLCIFNKRLTATSATDGEHDDWPWRYAKLCAQVSDWNWHEIAIHLVNTHFVEEAVIVAAKRNFPTDHPVYKLLEPHWLKTLSLNASARSALVPSVIVPIVGVSEDQTYAFIRAAYKKFNWTDLYIPTDLTKRGFPIKDLNNPKYKNYAYAKNMALMWQVLTDFVTSSLKITYLNNDAMVAGDQYIKAFCAEMQSSTGAGLKSFPTIKTFKELVDVIVMCIHTASPQHTSINYTQEYYYSFVINKPPSLFSPLPTTLSQIQSFTEKDILKALPASHAREWLLASHVPHLLSLKVAEDQTLINYAASLYNLSLVKQDDPTKAAAEKFYNDLKQLKAAFALNSAMMDDQTISYDVMDPDATAVSILI